jgi:hypothetical protein
MFTSGVTSVEDAECLGHSLISEADESVGQLKESALENRRITVCQFACIRLL